MVDIKFYIVLFILSIASNHPAPPTRSFIRGIHDPFEHVVPYRNTYLTTVNNVFVALSLFGREN